MVTHVHGRFMPCIEVRPQRLRVELRLKIHPLKHGAEETREQKRRGNRGDRGDRGERGNMFIIC